jgi:hypothetical protein
VAAPSRRHDVAVTIPTLWPRSPTANARGPGHRTVAERDKSRRRRRAQARALGRAGATFRRRARGRLRRGARLRCGGDGRRRASRAQVVVTTSGRRGRALEPRPGERRHVTRERSQGRGQLALGGQASAGSLQEEARDSTGSRGAGDDGATQAARATREITVREEAHEPRTRRPRSAGLGGRRERW